MNDQRGFSLIEVLVALLLTTVGVLGMMAMQGRAIEYTQDSVQRNIAVNLSNDLIETMRAHPDQVFIRMPPKFPMNSGLKSSSVFFKKKTEDFSSEAACVETATTIAKTATEQRNCWIANVKKQLPDATNLMKSDMYVCRSSTAGSCDGKGSIVELQLAWRTKEGACLDANASDPTICTYRVRVEL